MKLILCVRRPFNDLRSVVYKWRYLGLFEEKIRGRSNYPYRSDSKRLSKVRLFFALLSLKVHTVLCPSLQWLQGRERGERTVLVKKKYPLFCGEKDNAFIQIFALASPKLSCVSIVPLDPSSWGFFLQISSELGQSSPHALW